MTAGYWSRGICTGAQRPTRNDATRRTCVFAGFPMSWDITR